MTMITVHRPSGCRRCITVSGVDGKFWATRNFDTWTVWHDGGEVATVKARLIESAVAAYLKKLEV